jgi:hypothetical protein
VSKDFNRSTFERKSSKLYLFLTVDSFTILLKVSLSKKNNTVSFWHYREAALGAL